MKRLRKMKRLATVAALSLFLMQVHLLATPTAMAQVTTGNLQGVVTDPTGAVLAGVTVRVTNADTGISQTASTNEEGFYRVTNLIPGAKYRIEVSISGFSSTTLENVSVRLGTENNADVRLGSLQADNQVVDVFAGADLIKSNESQLSTNFTTEQLTQLPYVGLIDNLALLTPGVVAPGDTDFANGVGISANGNRGRSNNFQIDGQDNNDTSVSGPSLFVTNNEAIGEFQVITNSFSAEFGRNSGAQINVITKPGTNSVHGTLFHFLQNAALDARSNLDKKTQQGFQFLSDNGFDEFAGLADRYRKGPDPFTNNRFGGAIGGPIKKDSAFFFGTFERTLFRGESQANNLTFFQTYVRPEDALFLNERFNNAATSALVSPSVGGGPSFAQGVGQLFIAPPLLDTDGNGVPDAFAFEGVTSNLLAPLAVVDAGGGNLRTIYGGEAVRLYKTDSDNDQFIGRVDWNLTDDDRITGRYIWNDAEFPIAAGRFLSGALFDVPSTNHNVGVTYTRMLSSRFVNEARFNFSRIDVKFGDPDGELPGPGIQFAGGGRNLSGTLLPAFGTQNNLPQSRVVDVYQWQDTVSSTLGTHALKFGADIRRQNFEDFFLPNFLGTYVFQAGGNLPANTFFNLDGTERATATALENSILGRPTQIQFALGPALRKTHQNDFFFFVQDDWRVRPNLTLNLGLRYEVSTTPFNPLIESLNAREADPSTAIFDPSFPLEFRTARKLPIDKNNFGPRVGFAWSPDFGFLGERFTSGRTVIRGGFGIAYDPPFINIANNTVTAAPFAAAGIISQTPGAPGSVNFPFRPQTTAELNLTPGTTGGDPRLFSQTRVDPNFYNPYTMSFNFGIQQELHRGAVVEVRYVGSRVVGQFQTVNANPDLRFLNRAGQFLLADPGAFTGGRVTPGGTAENNFNSRAGTNGNGRLDPAFGNIRLRINGASSTYHGLQTRFDARVRNQLTLNANYTWSRTIDNASEIFATGGGGQTVAQAQNPFDLTEGERGLSAFHVGHNFSASFLWDLPFHQGQRGWKGKALGGWQFNGIIRMGSGQPYTPLEAFGRVDPSWDLGFVGAGALRPFNGNPDAPEGTLAVGRFTAENILGYTDSQTGTANASTFVLFNSRQPGSTGSPVSTEEAMKQARLFYNDFGTFTTFFPTTDPAEILPLLEAFNLFKSPYGDVGRNTFLGEAFHITNLSVFKNFKLAESKSLEFRVEAFNVFNHRNFGVPDPTTENVFNGFAVSSFQNPGFNNGGSRTMRLGVRFLF